MQISDIPAKFFIPFANNAAAGFIRTIPQNPPGIAGQASLFDGFPQICFVPVNAGGIPPSGQDFNGILNEITKLQRWMWPVPWDSAYATAIGGYPQGAMVMSPSTPGLFYVSAVDNNPNNPDSPGGTQWAVLGAVTKTRIQGGSGSFVTNSSDGAIGLALSGAASTSLPAGALAGYSVEYEDIAGTLFTNNCVISAPGGQTIAGAASYTMRENKMSSRFRYYGSNLWSVRSS